MSEIVFPLTIDVDGVTVSGEVTCRHGRFLTVEIKEPFTGMVRNYEMPAFLPPVFHGKRLDETARAGLKDLYQKLRFYHEHRDELRERWIRTKAELDYLEAVHLDAPVRLAKHKKELRRRFRNGELGQRQYQNELRLVRDRELTFRSDRKAIIERSLHGIAGGHSPSFDLIGSLIGGEL